MADAELAPDGSVHYDDLREKRSWPSVGELAAEYWAYQHLTGRDRERADQAAWACVSALMEDPSPRWVEVVQALVDSAATDGDLGLVGAHAIEELMRFNGHGDEVIDEVERRARRDRRFRSAVASMWLGDDLSPKVLARLQKIGAKRP